MIGSSLTPNTSNHLLASWSAPVKSDKVTEMAAIKSVSDLSPILGHLSLINGTGAPGIG